MAVASPEAGASTTRARDVWSSVIVRQACAESTALRVNRGDGDGSQEQCKPSPRRLDPQEQLTKSIGSAWEHRWSGRWCPKMLEHRETSSLAGHSNAHDDCAQPLIAAADPETTAAQQMPGTSWRRQGSRLLDFQRASASAFCPLFPVLPQTNLIDSLINAVFKKENHELKKLWTHLRTLFRRAGVWNFFGLKISERGTSVKCLNRGKSLWRNPRPLVARG